MDLFERATRPETLSHAPLATRMRPRDLDEFLGQEHLLGPGTPLRRAIERDELTSLILHGPAGCGKSTLARIIANRTRCQFIQFSAVNSGVADIRRAADKAREARKLYDRGTILFVDEIHRLNKAQQDAFLPYVEDGTIILIGATTENPYFEVNPPLISRCTVLELHPLSKEHLRTLIERALADEQRGLGRMKIELTPEALEHLLNMANGDARRALNTLEAAVMSVRPREDGVRVVDLAAAEAATQRRAVTYDKSGSAHYDVISAFIKSLRGSDPDAAIYWLARMIYAGEDPRFIARRMVIFAAEDVGNADPMALLVANAAAHAVEYVGMPEAQIPLAQAAIYLACAEKSNASYIAISRALADIQNEPPGPVPLHLQNATFEAERQAGVGAGYKYPHDYPEGYVPQQYFPDGVAPRQYYRPTNRGREAQFAERLRRLREIDKQQREGNKGAREGDAEEKR